MQHALSRSRAPTLFATALPSPFCPHLRVVCCLSPIVTSSCDRPYRESAASVDQAERVGQPRTDLITERRQFQSRWKIPFPFTSLGIVELFDIACRKDIYPCTSRTTPLAMFTFRILKLHKRCKHVNYVVRHKKRRGSWSQRILQLVELRSVDGIVGTAALVIR